MKSVLQPSRRKPRRYWSSTQVWPAIFGFCASTPEITSELGIIIF